MSGVQEAREERGIIMYQDCDDVGRKVDNGFVFKWLLRMIFKDRNELGLLHSPMGSSELTQEHPTGSCTSS